MKTIDKNGFSLIELLLVVTILGIIAALGVPAYLKSQRMAENRATFATLRTMSTAQVGCFSQRSRFCRLDELNASNNNGFGRMDTPNLVRGAYVFEMGGVTPSDEDLKEGYTITARRVVNAFDDVVYKYEIDQTGRIWQILPFAAAE